MEPGRLAVGVKLRYLPLFINQNLGCQHRETNYRVSVLSFSVICGVGPGWLAFGRVWRSNHPDHGRNQRLPARGSTRAGSFEQATRARALTTASNAVAVVLHADSLPRSR